MHSALKILLLTAAAVSLAAAARSHANTAPGAKPAQAIRSRVQLERYLSKSGAGDSPLAPLSPGGRKRFLAGLTFGPHGLTSLSSDDPAHELTQPQVAALFALFDAQRYAGALGLNPATYAALRAERIAAAARRGCEVQTCPESPVEQAYDRLTLAPPQGARSDLYDRTFASWQRPQALRSLDKPDLRLAQRAAWFAANQWPGAAHAQQATMVMDEMERHGMTSARDYRHLFEVLVAARQFAQAERVAREHLGGDAPALPHFVPSDVAPAGSPTALAIDAANGTMHRDGIDLGGPLHIVVIAGCHFSEAAARAVRDDPQLHALFASHATWLAAPSQPLADVAGWNREFSDMPMHVAWNTREWSMLDDWGMPTYYVFRNGRETARFQGWHGSTALKRALREAGVQP